MTIYFTLNDSNPFVLCSVASVKLPQKGQEYQEGDYFTETGWGYTIEGGSTATNLQIVEVPYKSDLGNCPRMFS
jgi:hypothetical protein